MVGKQLCQAHKEQRWWRFIFRTRVITGDQVRTDAYALKHSRLIPLATDTKGVMRDLSFYCDE